MNKKIIFSGVLAVAVMFGIVGGTLLNPLQTRAAETSAAATTLTQQTQPAKQDQFDPHQGGHVGSNGKKEEVLTGDIATKVTAAALKAVPGGTVERVETDAEGSAYEAHMTKSDGSRVTVKLDSNFTVTTTENGAH
ncbi:hypothetical protein BH09PAT2_BH09PAT2_00250 [soil metagenome]